MKVFQVWHDDEHGFSIIIAGTGEAAGEIYKAADIEREPPVAIDELADLSDLTPRVVLEVE